MFRKSLATLALTLLFSGVAQAQVPLEEFQNLKKQVASLETSVSQINQNVAAITEILKAQTAQSKPEEPSAPDVLRTLKEKLVERQDLERRRKEEREIGCVLRDLLSQAHHCDGCYTSHSNCSCYKRTSYYAPYEKSCQVPYAPSYYSPYTPCEPAPKVGCWYKQ